jgi:ribonuclease Z
VIGVIGLMRTMALQGRTDVLRLWGPKGAGRHLKRAEQFGVDRLTFEVDIRELDHREEVKRTDYAIVPFAVEHGPGPAMGYALVEADRKGRFDPDHARSIGVPEGPLWGRIHKGEPVTLPDGRVVQPSELVGPPRSGRTVVITGDTRPCENTVEAARNADLLVHEATFGDEEAERAIETGHSTAREAALVAKQAGCRRLLLSHFSARYSRDAGELEAQARSEFSDVVIGKDGMVIEVPYQ